MINLEVVLTQDDPKLGKRGDVLKVSSGYANNFLIPNRKALLATSAVLKNFEVQKARQAQHNEEILASAKKAASQFDQDPLEIEVMTGEGDKLYGAVTTQDIQETLAKRGIHVDRKQLHLEEPIRHLGAYEVPVKLHPEVKALFKLHVIKKKA